MGRRSVPVIFKMKDPSTGIVMFSQNFQTIPLFFKFLQEKGYPITYAILLRFILGKSRLPPIFNPLIYELEISSKDLEALQFSLKLRDNNGSPSLDSVEENTVL